MSDLSLEEAKRTLKTRQNHSKGVQRSNEKEIFEAFKVFIDSDPSEEEYMEHMEGIAITPRMFYHLVIDNE